MRGRSLLIQEEARGKSWYKNCNLWARVHLFALSILLNLRKFARRFLVFLVICLSLPHSGATNHPWISVNLPEPYGILQPQSDQLDIIGPLSQAAVFAFLSSFGSVIGGGSIQKSTGWMLHM